MYTLAIVNQVRNKILEAIAALEPWFQQDNQFLHHKPAEGGWSAMQILEHVMLTNHYLLLIIDKGSRKAFHRSLTTPIDVDWNDYVLENDALLEVGIHKSFEWSRPEHMEPSGLLSLQDIDESLYRQYIRCLTHLELLQNGEGVLHKTTMTVNDLGKLDVYQYIHFLALHTLRHVSQLEKILEAYDAQSCVME